MTLHTRQQLRGALIGTLLGDSWATSHGHFGCEQVTLELISYKRQLLEEYLNREINISERKRVGVVIEGRKINPSKTYTVRAGDASFKKFYNIFYKDNRKRLTYSLLKRISPEGIALWIMDDGYLDYKKSNNTRYMSICTDSYTLQEHELIIRMFKEAYDIECYIRYHQRNKWAEPKPRITFNGKNAQKLVALIYEFVLPCFYYKLDLKYLKMDRVNINPEYRAAIEYMSQHGTPIV